MTAEEHAHMQELEGLVKRYRSRIVELKARIAELERSNQVDCAVDPIDGTQVDRSTRDTGSER